MKLCTLLLRLTGVFVSCRIGFPFYEATFAGEFSVALVICSLYEHLGRIDDALEWATKKIDAGTDIWSGGCQSPVAVPRVLCVKGRCLAVKGQMAEAEEALRSAAKQYGGFGWYLPEGKQAYINSDGYVCAVDAATLASADLLPCSPQCSPSATCTSACSRRLVGRPRGWLC